MRKLLLFLIITFWSFAVSAKGYHYAYTENCSKAYQYYMALQPEKGDEYLKKELLADPYNLMATYLSDYKDCLLLLFNGDQQDYDQVKHHQNERLKLMERCNENTPWSRLCEAGIYMHWAFIHLRFSENLRAASDFRKSYLLIRDNKRYYPDFDYNDIFLGIEEATVGAIPDNYRWIAALFGMKGDVKNGVAKLDDFLVKHKKGDAFYSEALIYAAYMQYYLLSDKERAWKIVSSNNFVTRDNLVNSFVKANIALNYRRADEAYTVLNSAARIDGYKRYPIFKYELGYALLHKMDAAAIDTFRAFLSSYNGRIFVKDAWQKLAYAYYLNELKNKAEYCRGRIASEGSAVTDADKQALRFSEQVLWPDKVLLKAHLLTDGGYYKQGLAVLNTRSVKDFAATSEVLEYYFRLARVHDELGNDDSAIIFYNKAIKSGTDRKEQFAARSALQLGFMYEQDGQMLKAIEMYELALSMKDHDFKNSIDQQAKAGLNRLR